MATQRTVEGFKRVGRLLRAAGYRVIFMPGWTTRGKGDMHVRGLVNHHDASTEASGDEGALRVVMYGRDGLRNSLSAFTVARYSGTIRVIAAGRSWHAGYGRWAGYDDMNTYFAGDEAAGTTGEAWTAKSLQAQLALNVAICLVFDVAPGLLPEHKNCDPNRKVDRYAIDGVSWRRKVGRWVRRGEIPPADGTDTGEFIVRKEDQETIRQIVTERLRTELGLHQGRDRDKNNVFRGTGIGMRLVHLGNAVAAIRGDTSQLRNLIRGDVEDLLAEHGVEGAAAEAVADELADALAGRLAE